MYSDLVKEFHKTYDVPMLDKPGIPGKDRCKLRIELLAEELREFAEAIEEGDIEHINKEYNDLKYVLFGAGIEFGFENGVEERSFKEIHRSNMSKVCKDEATAQKLTNGTGAIREVPGGFVAYNASGKVLKPDTYSKADLSFLVQ